MERKAAVSRPLTLEWRPRHRKKAVFSFGVGSVPHSSELSVLSVTERECEPFLNGLSQNIAIALKVQSSYAQTNKEQKQKRLLTSCTDAVLPADYIRVSFIKLSVALHWDFTVVKLLDVPGVHRYCFKLHLTFLRQHDDTMTSLDIDPSQHSTDQTVTF